MLIRNDCVAAQEIGGEAVSTNPNTHVLVFLLQIMAMVARNV